MFYQLEVNDIHTISASACVLIRFSIYHPRNVVWLGTVKVTLLIQAPRNLTKCSSIIYVSFNDKLMGEGRERLRKETAGVGGKCSLCSLCFVAPSLEGRESMEINKPQLSLNSCFPGFFRWGCRRLPERMSTLPSNFTSDRSHSEMFLRAVAVNEDQPCEVYYCFLCCKCKTSFAVGGTAAKCTHNPINVPMKLIRNRGQEVKVTIAKFLCCWGFLHEVNHLVRFVSEFYLWALGVSAPRSLDSDWIILGESWWNMWIYFAQMFSFPTGWMKTQMLIYMLNQTADQNEWLMRSCTYLPSYLFSHQKHGIQN